MTSSEFFSPPWLSNRSVVHQFMKSSEFRQDWGAPRCTVTHYNLAKFFFFFGQPLAKFWMEFHVFIFREVSALCIWSLQDLTSLWDQDRSWQHCFLGTVKLSSLNPLCEKTVSWNKCLLRTAAPQTLEQIYNVSPGLDMSGVSLPLLSRINIW